MMRGVSLDWLRKVCSESAGKKILLYPAFGLELAFFPSCTTLDICVHNDVQRAWILLLIASMENLKRTGLETLLGLNKAGRRVFLYHQLRGMLDERTRGYWDQQEKNIRVGLLVDEGLERALSRVRYPQSSVRWNLLGQMILSRWLDQSATISSRTMFERMSKRRKSMWCVPWRYETLLSPLPEHQKKSILPKIGSVHVYEQGIRDRIKNAQENSIDVFFLWDSVDPDDIWSHIQRAGTRDSFVLIASKEEEPNWRKKLEGHVIAQTTDAHFSFGHVSWLRVHQKSDIHTLG